MALKDITLDDIISIVRGRGPRFHAKVRVNIEYGGAVHDGAAVCVRPDIVTDCDVDLRVLGELPGVWGKTAIDGYGGRLERMPGYAVADDDGQIYLVLAIPLDESPEEMR